MGAEPNEMTAAENARLREQLRIHKSYNNHYLEIAREASQALVRQLRGEPVEGWLDWNTELTRPESRTKLTARLHQSKQIAHSRYMEIQKLQAALRAEQKRVADLLRNRCDWDCYSCHSDCQEEQEQPGPHFSCSSCSASLEDE